MRTESISKNSENKKIITEVQKVKKVQIQNHLIITIKED